MFWLLVFYLVALVLLFMTSLWQQDVFTAELVRKWTTSNYDKLLSGEGGLWLRRPRLHRGRGIAGCRQRLDDAA